MPRRQQIIAVVIRQYGTGLYRTCVSLGRESLASIGTYTDEQSASERIAQFWAAYERGEIAHHDDIHRLMGEPSAVATVAPTTPAPAPISLAA